MECACLIDPYLDDPLDEDNFISVNKTAKKSYKCCECGIYILPGIEHRYEICKNDEETFRYRTCKECMSVRNVLFCNWVYGQIWQMVYDQIDVDGFIPESCLRLLTKVARDKICEMIEDIWYEGDGSL